MSTAGLALQKVLFERLSGHIPLVTAVTAIVDGPAPDQPLPYVQIGESIETDWSTKTFGGREHRLTLHVWTHAVSTMPVRQLLAEIDAALAAPLAPVGHKLASFRFISSRVIEAEGGRVRHGIAEYRARTHTDA